MPRFEQLRQPLAAILQEDTNSYWLAYQILNRLRVRFPDVLNQLEGQYGTGYGEGGGHNLGLIVQLPCVLEIGLNV